MKVNLFRLRSVPGDGSATWRLDVVVWPSSIIKLQPQQTWVINPNKCFTCWIQLKNKGQHIPVVFSSSSFGTNLVKHSYVLGEYYKFSFFLFRDVLFCSKVTVTSVSSCKTLRDLSRWERNRWSRCGHPTLYSPHQYYYYHSPLWFYPSLSYFSLPWPLIVMLCKRWILAHLVSPLLFTPPAFFVVNITSCVLSNLHWLFNTR